MRPDAMMHCREQAVPSAMTHRLICGMQVERDYARHRILSVPCLLRTAGEVICSFLYPTRDPSCGVPGFVLGPIRRRSPDQPLGPNPHEHHTNEFQPKRSSGSGRFGYHPAVVRSGPPSGTRADTRRPRGLHVEQELWGNCTQTERERCSEAG